MVPYTKGEWEDGEIISEFLGSRHCGPGRQIGGGEDSRMTLRSLNLDMEQDTQIFWLFGLVTLGAGRVVQMIQFLEIMAFSGQ